MSFKADLHCHTTCSDGSLTPKELILLAKASGLTGLSITDHDSLLAYPEAFKMAEEEGITLIPGIEFSTQWNGTSVHILAYSFDYRAEGIKSLCEKHLKRRVERSHKILDKLRSHGMEISEEELSKTSTGVVGRPHIAKLLVEKGYVPDIPSAFHRLLGDKKKCFVPCEPITIEETLLAIKEAKGLSVLAHPHLYHNKALVKEILKFPFDGLECEYAIMPAAKNQPWLTIAKEKRLLITAGSDFHGSMKPEIPLGATTLDFARFEPLLSHFKALS